jgi:biopolymer transport protein ExbD
MKKPASLAKLFLAEEEPEFQMAPMIDIVFQLLIFFMCVTTLQSIRIEKLELPFASSSVKPDNITGAAVINLNWQGGDKLDFINLNGEQIPFATLPDRLKKLREHNQEMPVMLRADKRVRYRHVRAVMDACAAAGVGKFTVVTMQKDLGAKP